MGGRHDARPRLRVLERNVELELEPLAASDALGLIMWLIQPHKAAGHAAHRLRFHIRRLRPRSGTDPNHPAQMSDARFDALEDEVDDALADATGDR